MPLSKFAARPVLVELDISKPAPTGQILKSQAQSNEVELNSTASGSQLMAYHAKSPLAIVVSGPTYDRSKEHRAVDHVAGDAEVKAMHDPAMPVTFVPAELEATKRFYGPTKSGVWILVIA